MPLPITLFFTVATALLAHASGRFFWQGLRRTLRTIGWRRTTGTVARCELRDGTPVVIAQARRARSLELAVEYTVDGVSYTTGRVSALARPQQLFYAGPTLARLRRRFQPGARVPVHYDPASPGDALLLRAEPGKLLAGAFFTLVFGIAAPLILWGGLTVMEPTRAREVRALQALERQAPPVLAHLQANPALGRAQHARGFSEGGPFDTPPTTLAGDWIYGVETTEGYFHFHARQGSIVEVTEWENPSGDPRWVLAVKGWVGLR